MGIIIGKPSSCGRLYCSNAYTAADLTRACNGDEQHNPIPMLLVTGIEELYLGERSEENYTLLCGRT